MNDATKELDAMAKSFEDEANRLLDLAKQEAKARRFIRADAAAHASGVYENDLRTQSASIGECARRLRERARSLRGEEAA